MKRRILALCLFTLAVSAACGTRNGAVSPAAKDDVAQVEAVLVQFSAALATADEAKLKSLSTPSFALVDEGKVFDFPGLIASIRPVIATGKMTRTPVDLHTEVEGDVAWSRYRVTGSFGSGEVSIPLSFLETAVLRRENNQWRIAQLSTQPAKSAASSPP